MNTRGNEVPSRTHYAFFNVRELPCPLCWQNRAHICELKYRDLGCPCFVLATCTAELTLEFDYYALMLRICMQLNDTQIMRCAALMRTGSSTCRDVAAECLIHQSSFPSP